MMHGKKPRDGDVDTFDSGLPRDTGPWVTPETKQKFQDSLKKFEKIVASLNQANVDARAAARALEGWVELGEQALAILRPVIERQLAGASASSADTSEEDLDAIGGKVQATREAVTRLRGLFKP